MQYLASFIISALTFIGLYNYLPLDLVAFNQGVRTFGSTITTIQGSDTLSASRSVINTNFANLNSDKIENSTTSVKSITTLSSLSSIGTITTGVWNGTAVTVPYGGTGSTTLGSNLILVGNGTSNVKTVTGLGNSGQVLMSNGAGAAPSWNSSSVDTTQPYSWTNHHIFTSLRATIASTTNATSTTSHYFPFLTSTLLKTDSTGKLTAATAGTDYQSAPVSQSGTNGTATNTSTSTITTITIPSGSLTSAQTLAIAIFSSGSGTNGICSFDVQFGSGSASSTIAAWRSGGNCNSTWPAFTTIHLQADDGTSSQLFSATTEISGGATRFIDMGSASINTSGTTYIAIRARVASGDTATLSSYSVILR